MVGDKFVLGFAQSTATKKLYKTLDWWLEIAPFGGDVRIMKSTACAASPETAQVHRRLGIGGGKTLDTAKALAHFMNVPVAIARPSPPPMRRAAHCR